MYVIFVVSESYGSDGWDCITSANMNRYENNSVVILIKLYQPLSHFSLADFLWMDVIYGSKDWRYMVRYGLLRN